jgi:hypothetical protein
MNLRRVVLSETNTEYGPAELLTARNQRGEITALLAVERNYRDLHEVRFRLDSVSRAVREFNDGVDPYLNRRMRPLLHLNRGFKKVATQLEEGISGTLYLRRGTRAFSRPANARTRVTSLVCANNRHFGSDAVFNRHDETPTVDMRARYHGGSVARI